MMRYTEKRKGKNVIPLRNAVCGVDLPKWSIDKHSDIQSFLSGDAVDHLAELEDAIEQGKLIFKENEDERLACRRDLRMIDAWHRYWYLAWAYLLGFAAKGKND